MIKFSRWDPPQIKKDEILPSWAFMRFRRFHSEINHMYWAMVASSKAAFSNTKGFSKEDSLLTAFHLQSQDIGYRDITLEKWKNDFKDFQNWSRLNVLMALCSYFENYLQTIGNLSIEANPGILFNASKVLDGTVLLKSENKYIFINETIGLVKGDWNSRVAEFKRLFGNCPSSLENYLSELDKIRLIRNCIGHSFGRTLDAKDLLNATNYHPMVRVSEKRLKKWLGIVYQIAQDIDQYLLIEHIGAYEIIKYYHNWYIDAGLLIKGNKNPNHIRKLNIVGFKRYFSEELISVWGGIHLSQPYLIELIDYYGG